MINIVNEDMLFKYYKKMDDYTILSHKNQLEQECAELIMNITKIRQRVLNNQLIRNEEINNFPEELLHVKLIIDYLIERDRNLIPAMNKEFNILCNRHGVR